MSKVLQPLRDMVLEDFKMVVCATEARSIDTCKPQLHTLITARVESAPANTALELQEKQQLEQALRVFVDNLRPAVSGVSRVALENSPESHVTFWCC